MFFRLNFFPFWIKLFATIDFLTSLKFADEGTRIIVDDYIKRPYYHNIFEKYTKPVEQCGHQAMFVVPQRNKINFEEIEKDIKIFRNFFN